MPTIVTLQTAKHGAETIFSNMEKLPNISKKEQSSARMEADNEESNKNEYVVVDWQKINSDKEYAEICEKLEDNPCLYENEICFVIEKDSLGHVIPKMPDNSGSSKIAIELLGQLGNWNLTLPPQNRVFLLGPLDCCRFNRETRIPDVAVSTNYFPDADTMMDSVVNPHRSPEFVVEICRFSRRTATKQKIENSYLVAGTNTRVAILICCGSVNNSWQVQLEFFVKRNNQAVPVLGGPIWRDWSAAEIPELADILPGFVFNSNLVLETLQTFRQQ